jgi:uncharacterized protein YjiS (DUF1127 family)
MTSLYVLYDNPELNLKLRRATPVMVAIKRALTRFEKWNDSRLARAQLGRMPDYLLRDVGIERCDIDRVARGLVRT